MPTIINFLGYNPLPDIACLAAELKRYRVSRGITQEALAKKLGIDQCTLARWERGERTPTGLYRQLVEQFLANPAASLT